MVLGSLLLSINSTCDLCCVIASVAKQSRRIMHLSVLDEIASLRSQWHQHGYFGHIVIGRKLCYYEFLTYHQTFVKEILPDRRNNKLTKYYGEITSWQNITCYNKIFLLFHPLEKYNDAQYFAQFLNKIFVRGYCYSMGKLGVVPWEYRRKTRNEYIEITA